MSWDNVLTGQQVRPTNSSYLAVTLNGADVSLVWPLESIEGNPYVASAIDVTATVGGLHLIMPDATGGSTGIASYITNVGSNSFTVRDSQGGTIGTISAGLTWMLVLTDNSTSAGTWRLVQFGATTSTAQASALAGPGLIDSGSVLETNDVTAVLNTPTTITTAYRAKVIVWTGAAGTLTLDLLANNGVGWNCMIINEGTGNLTIATSGSDSINTGVVSITLPPGSLGNCFGVRISASSTNYNISGSITLPLAPSAGGTGAVNDPTNILTMNGHHSLNFTLTADTNVTLPASGTLATLGMNIFTGIQEIENGVQVVRNSIYSDIFQGIVCNSGSTVNLFNMPLVSANLVDGITLIYAYRGTGIGVGGLIMQSQNEAEILAQWFTNTSFAVSGQFGLVGTSGVANSWFVTITQTSGSPQTYKGGYLCTCGPVSF